MPVSHSTPRQSRVSQLKEGKGVERARRGEVGRGAGKGVGGRSRRGTLAKRG